MGHPGASQKKYPTGTDVNAFFPKSIAVRTGDVISFSVSGFHSVHFLAKGKFAQASSRRPPSTASSTPPACRSGSTGRRAVVQPPALEVQLRQVADLLRRQGDPQRAAAFGPGGPPKPVRIRFTKAGLFKYICDLHPGMKGSVRVNARGKGVPSAAADAKRVRAQVASTVAAAKGLECGDEAAREHRDRRSAGQGRRPSVRHGPGQPCGPRRHDGDVRMASGSTENHTASFGPGAETFGGQDVRTRTRTSAASPPPSRARAMRVRTSRASRPGHRRRRSRRCCTATGSGTAGPWMPCRLRRCLQAAR